MRHTKLQFKVGCLSIDSGLDSTLVWHSLSPSRLAFFHVQNVFFTSLLITVAVPESSP